MKSKRILIIEDDENFARYLRACIVGAELFFVETLKGAMEQLEANRFDMVICDLLLPDWEGKPEALLTMVSMRAKGAVIAAISGRVSNLPNRVCNASAHKINLGKIDNVLAFLREAEKDASKQSTLSRPIRALENFVALGQQNAQTVPA